jgi:thymidylate synthase (FAD)
LSDITLTSEITVEEVQHVGDDAMIAHAAMVSTRGVRAGEAVPPAKVEGLIRYLMDNRHGTPFEHGSLTVRVHAPIKVWREWHRHRIGWSYNEESGRYKDLEPVFYVPPRGRPMIRGDGFKSSRPAFDVATDEEYANALRDLESGYRNAYEAYRRMLAFNIDRGLARDVLGVGIYSACYCTANPRSIMAFLELRTNEPAARRPSKPLYEIEVAARKLEAIFAARWPVTYAAWQAAGRAAP